MGRGDWDCYMVHTKIGTHRKLRRLDDSQWRAFIGGVLAIAAESPVRGVLLIEEGIPADANDVAAHAGVSVDAAESAIEKATELKLIEFDTEHDAHSVIDWYEWNPARPKDPTGAARQKRWRDRKKGVTGNDDRNVTGNGPSDGGGNAAETTATVSPNKEPDSQAESVDRNVTHNVTSDGENNGLVNENARLTSCSSSSSSKGQRPEDSPPPALRDHQLPQLVDEAHAALNERWPDERNRESYKAMVRIELERVVFDSADPAAMVKTIIDAATAQFDAHGWMDDPTYCPNLHTWAKDRRWTDALPAEFRRKSEAAGSEYAIAWDDAIERSKQAQAEKAAAA